MSYEQDELTFETPRSYPVLGILSTIIGGLGYLLIALSFFVGWLLYQSDGTTSARVLFGFAGLLVTALLGLAAIAYGELLTRARDVERNSRRTYELLEELVAESDAS
jgi:hypothetical protein